VSFEAVGGLTAPDEVELVELFELTGGALVSVWDTAAAVVVPSSPRSESGWTGSSLGEVLVEPGCGIVAMGV